MFEMPQRKCSLLSCDEHHNNFHTNIQEPHTYMILRMIPTRYDSLRVYAFCIGKSTHKMSVSCFIA